jgi:hypothetical protein
MTTTIHRPRIPVAGFDAVEVVIVDDYQRDVVALGRTIGTIEFHRFQRGELVRWGYRIIGEPEHVVEPQAEVIRRLLNRTPRREVN